MADLAGFIFVSFEERILVLKSAIGDGASTAEYRGLNERYLVVRSHMIHVLGQSFFPFARTITDGLGSSS